jgi:hypothetical protein
MTSTSRFERVLPPEARTQLAHRKRFRPLKALWSAPLAWLIAGAALIVALVATLPQPKPGFVPAAGPAPEANPQPALAPVSIPRTAAIPQPALPVQLRTPAPRAALVKLPPPRAALVRLPEWQPGTSRLLYMPYRLEVVGQLQGRLSERLCCLRAATRSAILGSSATRLGSGSPPLGRLARNGSIREDASIVDGERLTLSFNATAPIRSELTSRSALERETKGKSSSTEAQADRESEPNALKMRRPVSDELKMTSDDRPSPGGIPEICRPFRVTAELLLRQSREHRSS